MYAITWSPSWANRMRSPACTTGVAALGMAKQPQARASVACAATAATAVTAINCRSMVPSSSRADAGAEVALRVGTTRHERDVGARPLDVGVVEEAQRKGDRLVDDRDADRRRAHEHRDGRRHRPPAVGSWRADVDGAAIAQDDGAVGDAVRVAFEREAAGGAAHRVREPDVEAA